MMTEEIQQLLNNLRLRKVAEIVEEELAAALKPLLRKPTTDARD